MNPSERAEVLEMKDQNREMMAKAPQLMLGEYAKLGELRTLLVQHFTGRLFELAGPALAEKRRVMEAQQPELSEGATVRPSQAKFPPLELIVTEYLLNSSLVLHALAGSTPASAAVMEKRRKSLVGLVDETVASRLIDEVDAFVLQEARTVKTTSLEELRKKTAATRARVQQILHPDAPNV
jgi:hypothetical protein